MNPGPPGFTYFQALKTTPQPFMANFIDVVTFNDVIFDRNNEFNVFASEFTATRTGFYTFCAQVKLRGSQPGGGNSQLFLFKNRSSQGFIAELGSVTIQGNQCVQISGCTTQVFLQQGETVQALFQSTVATTVHSGYFEGIRTQ
ncbi:hypothetical protein SAMN05428981_11267 [Bacillus sp. OV194]|nr:hypothetical protein SAMN05428981_11267 [Bacillus sp. OV194]